jgi:hypothetical protein
MTKEEILKNNNFTTVKGVKIVVNAIIIKVVIIALFILILIDV